MYLSAYAASNLWENVFVLRVNMIFLSLICFAQTALSSLQVFDGKKGHL